MHGTINRFEVAVQAGLTIELGLVCVHAIAPMWDSLPFGGSEFTQLSLSVVSPIMITEIAFHGRKCVRAVWAWLRSDENNED